jgi:hypothetical protein
LKARTASVEGSWSESSATEPLQSVLSMKDQSPGAHQGVATLVVDEEIFLVGIDERHVETPTLALGEQSIERAQGRSEAELDLVRDASLLPMALGCLGDLGIDIAGEDLAVRRQGKRDRQRAVTGVSADLKIAPNAEEACEQGHEVRLFRRKQHVNTGEVSGFLADPLQCRMFAKAHLQEVLMEWVGQSERSRGHGCLLEELALRGIC